MGAAIAKGVSHPRWAFCYNGKVFVDLLLQLVILVCTLPSGPDTASRPSTGASVQSSLMSGDIGLPDEAVYKKYDNAIANMDDPDEVETAVGVANKSQSSRPDSVSFSFVRLIVSYTLCTIQPSLEYGTEPPSKICSYL